MTPTDFRAFRERFFGTSRKSRRLAAEAFRVPVRTWAAWETGRRKIALPYVMQMAMSAFAQNLPPYGGER